MSDSFQLDPNNVLIQTSKLISYDTSTPHPGHTPVAHRDTLWLPGGTAVVEHDYTVESVVPLKPYADLPVGDLIAFYDFVNDPTAFGKLSHSWFNGAPQNGVPTSPLNAVQGPNGIDLWLRNGVGASINTNVEDAAKPGAAFGQGVMQVYATMSSILKGPFTINYHGANGANNGPSVTGNWLDAPHYFTEQRVGSDLTVIYDRTVERTVPVTDGDAPHYFVANVGANFWVANRVKNESLYSVCRDQAA
jgi:hypothetical protein